MKNWENAIVDPDTSLEEAVRVIEREGLRIVLVAGTDRRLLGTLTDGDVRRALLNRLPLSVRVKDVMFAHPKVAYPDWDKQRMLNWMEEHQLLQLPIVDAQGIIVGLETLHSVLQRQRRENPVFLMAGGFGKRLRPLTDNCPKPMLRIGEKPILELILMGFVDAGFHRFYISTHYMPEIIRDYFGDGSRWGIQIQYIHEDEPLGTGGALGLLPHEEIDQSVFMMNGDLLTTVDFLGLLDFHAKYGGAATMCVREYEHQVPYGVIQASGHQIVDMVEKPVHKFFVNAGIYLLSKELVHSVRPNTKIDMPTLLQRQIDAGKTVNMFPLHEYWLDIGRLEDFQRAQSEIVDLREN